MRVEAIARPITYRWPQGEVLLRPGRPVELPDDRARRLLEKASGKVRAVGPAPVPTPAPVPDGLVAEPAIRPDGGAVTPVFYEDGDGRIQGPYSPELFSRCGSEFWVCLVTSDGLRWVSSDRLRTRSQFKRQVSTPCCGCGSLKWWLSIYGATICARCHPPASAALVVRWIHGETKE